MEKSGNQFESLPVRSTATNLKLRSELTKLPTVGHYILYRCSADNLCIIV